MKILLDENFPLPLYAQLRSAGYDAEHIIVLGQRGIKDSELRKRVTKEEMVFLTQDAEFEDVASDCRGKVIISRVRQNLPIQRRVELWFSALQRFMIDPPHGNSLIFLTPDKSFHGRYARSDEASSGPND